MRFTDLVYENTEVQDAILDLLTSMAGEGLDSIPMDSIIKELSAQGIDIDYMALFDTLSTFTIVRNIKDDVVYFNSDSDQSHNSNMPDPKQQDQQVSKLAQKQVDKAIKQ